MNSPLYPRIVIRIGKIQIADAWLLYHGPVYPGEMDMAPDIGISKPAAESLHERTRQGTGKGPTHRHYPPIRMITKTLPGTAQGGKGSQFRAVKQYNKHIGTHSAYGPQNGCDMFQGTFLGGVWQQGQAADIEAGQELFGEILGDKGGYSGGFMSLPERTGCA